ncbi:MAG: PfkB family carbohydrate kinase [Sphingobacteriales bacterium]|nr:PfkB family carbohydrate kinase [Sphingobacteriales bacterium]
MSKPDFEKLFQQMAQTKVGVIGDVMLDTYWWGTVDRISPEAPVPVVAVSKKEQRIGGAGNVALNIKAMGAPVTMLSVIGKDEDGDQLAALLEKEGIGASYLVQSTARITTNKIRIISRNQHMMRLDAEMSADMETADEEKLIYAIENFIAAEQPDVMILEDYNKGVLTPRVIEAVISLCKKQGIITTVDPKRKNFFSYTGVDVFKPNWKEVKEGLNILVEKISESLLKDIHVQLEDRLKHKISLITLSEKGVFYQQDADARLISTHIRNVADVSGAGDTVIAIASLVYAASRDMHLMAEVANIAGGLVCEEVGTVAINRDKLFAECCALLP